MIIKKFNPNIWTNIAQDNTKHYAHIEVLLILVSHEKKI